jgi:hypothetical protein
MSQNKPGAKTDIIYPPENPGTKTIKHGLSIGFNYITKT